MKENEDFEMVATTLFGLEEVLSNELKTLGAKDIKFLKRAVSFVGDKGFMYKANYCLRTALRILKPIASFTVSDDHNLYTRIQTIDWSTYLSVNDLLAVSCSLNTDIFNHTQYISQKTKDAIVDQFRAKTGLRPSVDLDNPKIRIHIHIDGNLCTVSLDSSGQPLYKRGYRKSVDLAPLNESLAAGLIIMSGWKPSVPFIDPMCGSGTLAIEAGLMAANVPPGYFRESFGFQKWDDYDAPLFELIAESAIAKINNNHYTIKCSDASAQVIEKAKLNIKQAGLEDMIQVEVGYFEQLPSPETPVFLVMNPPYGERLVQEDINALYKNIGSTLKQKYQGSQAWIISSNKEAVNNIGLHHSRRITLFNGALECKFLRYDMYAGSKKGKYIQS